MCVFINPSFNFFNKSKLCTKSTDNTAALQSFTKMAVDG